MAEGQNQNSRADKASEFQGGTVHLLSTAIGDSDGDTQLQSNSEASAGTADADWSITADNNAGTTVLENTSAIDFGEPSGFTVNQIVIQSTDVVDNLILDPSPSGDTDLSGDGTVTIEANQLSYTFGSEP